MDILATIRVLLRALLANRASLAMENLTKTTAMQAGSVARPLTFRQLFTSEVTGRSFAVLVVLACRGVFRPMLRLAA